VTHGTLVYIQFLNQNRHFKDYKMEECRKNCAPVIYCSHWRLQNGFLRIQILMAN